MLIRIYNLSEIDVNENQIIIVENGKLDLISIPAFGTVEIPVQNKKIGNVTIKNTYKRA